MADNGLKWMSLVIYLSRYQGRLRKRDYHVRDIDIATGIDIVRRYHYAAGASKTKTYLHGLFQNGTETCLGVAWWIPPTRTSATKTNPDNPNGVLSLSRLVIVPDVPKNACSFLLAESRKRIDSKRWPVLVTYADEWRSHTGTIYKADNWIYIGLTKPERIFQIDGKLSARKNGSGCKTHAEMYALGAVLVGYYRKHKYVYRS